MPGAIPDLLSKVEPQLISTITAGLVLMLIGAMVRNYFLGKALRTEVDQLKSERDGDRAQRKEDADRIGALEREVPQVSLIVDTLKVGFDQLREEWHTGFAAVIERVQEQGENIQFIRGRLSSQTGETT